MKKDNQSQKKSFKEMFDFLTQALPERSKEIVKKRFGVGGRKYTLNSIGDEYGITRERVRQIIKEALNRVGREDFDNVLTDVSDRIKFTIRENSGIMNEVQLLNLLSKNSQEMGCVEFFLECIDGVEMIEKKGEIKKSFAIKDFDIKRWKEIKSAAKNFLSENKSALKEDEFFAGVGPLLNNGVTQKEFIDFMQCSEEIKINSFGKWGLVKWNEITPKGARQKAYLVIKEVGKPLHFREVTELIDKYGLSKKKSHPQTVHNELIKDKRFVLIGRGVYALSEWGYNKGTVKDVIEDILKKSEGPMKRSEIMSQALAVRKVKKSTIVINLNSFFKKVEKDMYSINETK